MSLTRVTQVKNLSETLYGLSGSLWPIHLKPLPHELLSSWLVRLAHGHGLKLQTFCAVVFGNNRNIWNRDIDKLAPEWLLQHLATATGTSIGNVMATTLKSYEGILYETHQPNGNTKWINPLGIYHRVHKGYGLQYCPISLAQDKEPYFRKYWRLAFYTECEKHHILLHDRCPKCGNPINFHRVEMGIRSLIKPRSLINCYKCDFDLRFSPVSRISCADLQTTIHYRTLLDFHDMGWGFTTHSTIHYSHQKFDVLRHLCVMMHTKNRARGLLLSVVNQLGFELNEIPPFAIIYEKLKVEKRHQLFHCAIWLIQEWPARFIKTCQVNKLSSAYLLKDFNNPPYWFYSVIDEYLNQGQYSPTSTEIDSAKAYLYKIGKDNGITNTSRLLGYTTLKRN